MARQHPPPARGGMLVRLGPYHPQCPWPGPPSLWSDSEETSQIILGTPSSFTTTTTPAINSPMTFTPTPLYSSNNRFSFIIFYPATDGTGLVGMSTWE